jgi:hypothetical protein
MVPLLVSGELDLDTISQWSLRYALISETRTICSLVGFHTALSTSGAAVDLRCLNVSSSRSSATKCRISLELLLGTLEFATRNNASLLIFL